MRTTGNRGISVIELLIVLAILGALLALLAAFFNMQARTTSSTQAANEVEVSARTAAEIVMQDLQMSGSRIVVDNSGTTPTTTYVNVMLDHCNPLKGSSEHCVSVSGGQLTMYYATSLRLATQPCRRVDYRLSDGVLERSDVACSGDSTVDNSLFVPFVDNVTQFEVAFLCENGDSTSETDWLSDPASCYAVEGNFPQQARVTLAATSANTREARDTQIVLTTTMPNLRPVAVSQ